MEEQTGHRDNGVKFGLIGKAQQNFILIYILIERGRSACLVMNYEGGGSIDRCAGDGRSP